MLRMLCSDFGLKKTPKNHPGWCLPSRLPCFQQVHFGKVGKPELMISPHLSRLRSCQAVPRRKESAPKTAIFPSNWKQTTTTKNGYKNTTEVSNGLVPVPLREEAAREVYFHCKHPGMGSARPSPALRGSAPHCRTCRPCSPPLKAPEHEEWRKISPDSRGLALQGK